MSEGINIFMTDPDNVDYGRRYRRSDHDYKEEIVAELMRMNVPMRKAELAVIDLKQYVIEGWHNKDSALTTALKMFREVKRIYRC